ncbi:ATP-dependent Clp protease ATP-binding subunit [Waltera intestinalis]|jgi:ATP-dependent Clp protease ATP-binding subunit ClpC|nr:ATP-dependent Clp protease ATP-binding subunit [Bacillota bacterium]RHQ78542.1 ATP-dependent Clp protease ATP-binding subunit [Firmicutes bacterium AF22-6AC]SCH87886.1 ATP-dependent Clp protease ATP-binding subunit ClpC [uncultured Clostridium sp.]
MQSQFTDKAQNALAQASRCARSLKQGYIGTEHILVGLLKEDTGVAAKVLADNGVETGQVMDMIRDLIAFENGVAVKDREGYSPRAARILEEAHHQAARFGQKQTGTEHLLLALIKEGENVAVRLLNTLGANVQKIYVDTLIAIGQDGNLYKEDLGKKGDRKAKQSTLEQYSRDLTALAREGKLDPVVGRNEEIRRVIQILSRRTKNNPCLVGEPGVGKTAVVEGLAARIVAGDVPFTVQNKRVLTLDLSGMVAGSKYRGEFEERIKKVLKEVTEDGNIILFLDELHTIIGAGGAEGAIDASNIMKPSLARGEIQLIGATTIAEYRKYIEKDAALERRFQPVTVEEPTEEEAVRILEGIKGKYEAHHHVTITPEAVEAAVRLSSRYINDRNLPDKAIDLIDEAAASARLHAMDAPDKAKEISDKIRELDWEMEKAIRVEAFAQMAEIKKKQDALVKKQERLLKKREKREEENTLSIGENEIAEVVAQWTKIPVQKLAEKESERLLKLEKTLHKRVIGQEEAVTAVAKAIRRGRVGLKDPNRPIGSFLFLGPTGVGKTELSKALAEAMFGSEDAMIRVDMSEYMEGHSVSKMIGSPPGYVGFEEGGQLSEKVRRNPYSVVLFDEIEKAHPDVFNVLLQVLDDGHITDSKGRKVSFKNTVLIMTSNAGAQRIVDPKNLGFATEKSETKDYEKMKSNVMEEVKRSFKPEFINRIDDIIVFHQLNNENMKEIVNLLASNLYKRCEDQLGIHLTITAALKEHLVKKYADNKMGARPLKRAIQSVVEDALAEEILLKKVVPGDKVSAGFKNGKVVFTVKN